MRLPHSHSASAAPSSRRTSPRPPLSPALPQPCRPASLTSPPSQGLTEHTYTLDHSSSPAAYLALSLLSAAPTPDHVPVIRQCPPVEGRVVLELASLRNVKDLLISVHGRLHTPSAPPSTFLSHTLSLLSPATPQPAPETSTLEGTHTLPFHFYLPSLGSNGLPLPPSWSSALSPSCKIEYSLSLRLRPHRSRPHFGSSSSSSCSSSSSGDDTLSIPITFVPKSPPTHNTREKSPSLGWPASLPLWPTARSDWHLTSTTLRGAQLSQRDVPLRATLGLAAPLVYPVQGGWEIPFSLTIVDEGKGAADVLSAPIAISVDLRRGVRYVPTSSSAAGGVCPRCASKHCGCPERHHHLPSPLHHHHHHHHAPQTLAQEWTWTPVSTTSYRQLPHPSPHIRIVHGSLSLPSDDDEALEPSFEFGGLSVGYAVHVSFGAPVPGGRAEEERFSFVEPVTLVSADYLHPHPHPHPHPQPHHSDVVEKPPIAIAPLTLIPTTSSDSSSTSSSPSRPPTAVYSSSSEEEEEEEDEDEEAEEPPSYEQVQARYGYTGHAHARAQGWLASPVQSPPQSRPATPTHGRGQHQWRSAQPTRSSSLAPDGERRRSGSGERWKGSRGVPARWMSADDDGLIA